MSGDATAMTDPFEATALDEETELAALASSLRLADGFRLLFARCNQPNQRIRLITKLMSDFPPETTVGVHFADPIPHLLDALRERLPASPPRTIFVSGIEHSLPIAAEAESTAFIANLNASRNSFPSAIPCPLVLWLPEYALTAIVRGAPDFFSISSGVYFFASLPEETAPQVDAVTAGNDWQLASLPLSERQERVEAIERLLQDYQALPSSQRDHRAELQLLERLGHLHSSLGHWAKAVKAYQKSLQICRDMGWRQGEGAMLNSLGIVYGKQGHWMEAEGAYVQTLQISLELNNRRGEGAALGNLGTVYQSRGQWPEAEQAHQQDLQISHDLGNRQGEGQALNNLGIIYQQQERWLEAEQAHQRSLNIRRELEDHQGEGAVLGNLGILYRRQGRWAEAEQVLQQALQINRNLGDKEGEGMTLRNLASVKLVEGNIEEANSYGRAAIQVLATTEAAALLKETQDLLTLWGKLEQTPPDPVGR